jgi:rubrerythrin
VKIAARIYRRFVEFEERAAAIYLWLASRFSQDRKLSAFWLDMAMHEKQHAGLLQFCLQEELFSANLPTSGEVQKVAALFKRFEKRATGSQLTIEEAFSLAIEMESCELNDIYCHLTTPLHSSMYLLRRKIEATIPNHIDELVRTARKFGVANDALKQLNRLKEHCSSQSQPPRRSFN